MSGFAHAEAGHASVQAASSKISALTGIRGIAAVWVVLFHLSAVATVGHVMQFSGMFFIRSGHLAVDMFFILSGYVLALTYGRALQRPTWTVIRDFWIGRAFRILPLHWFALTLCLVLYSILGDDLVMTQRHDAISFIASALLIQDWIYMPKVWNLPAWSLSAEWLAYITLPVTILLSARLTTFQATIGACLMWSLLIAACIFAHDISLDHIRSLGLVRCLTEFPIGVLMYRIWSINKVEFRHGNLLFMGGIAVLITAMSSSILELLAIPAFAMIVLAAGTGSSFAKMLMGNSVAKFLGNISFSAYILHWVIVEIAAYVVVTRGMNGDEGTWVLALAFAAVWPIAWLNWRHIELPSQNCGKAALRYVRARSTPDPRAADIPEAQTRLENWTATGITTR